MFIFQYVREVSNRDVCVSDVLDDRDYRYANDVSDVRDDYEKVVNDCLFISDVNVIHDDYSPYLDLHLDVLLFGHVSLYAHAHGSQTMVRVITKIFDVI